MRRVALAMALAACGARTDLGGAHTDTGNTGVCTPPPPAPKSCTTWHAGTPRTIATGATLADATASGCGVLVASYTATNTSIAWSTQWVDYDGSMLGPPVAHPSLAAQTKESGSISLASNGDETGMLESDDTGCHFVAADVSGHEQGALLDFGVIGCVSLARAGTRWTFLHVLQNGGASLVVFEGGNETESQLPLSQPEYAWDRVVFADGSFLLSGFYEDTNTAKYTNWLTAFEADGNALGPSVPVIGFESAPVHLARAGNGAIAAWQWSTVEAMPVDVLGQPQPKSQTVATDQPIYDLALFSAPNGDVLVTWVVLDEKTNRMSLHARAIGPDATPRGPATLLADDVGNAHVRGAVESTGARAVLAVTTKDGAIESLPLSCQ